MASASSARDYASALGDGGFGAAAGSSVPVTQVASTILLPLSSQQWAEAASHGDYSRDSTFVSPLP